VNPPRIVRPEFPPGYADNPASFLTWERVEAKLAESKNYWLCSVRPDGRPHTVPRWGVFLDNKFYYDGSPETRHAQNLAINPHVALHLESGDEAVILEGESHPASKPDPELAARLAEGYRAKYAAHGYSPEPTQWDNGGLFLFTPRQCLAWTVFYENPTKFIFDS